MKENQKHNNNGLLHYLHLFLKWRWFIIFNVLIIMILTYAITFLFPKEYYSKSVLLPPKDEGGLGGVMGIGGVARIMGVPGAGRLLGQFGTYNYLAILNSRTLQEEVIREFNLMEVYKIKDNSMEKTLKSFNRNIDFKIDDEGALNVGVYDRDPEKAAAIANYIVKLLHDYSTEMSGQEARARRLFIERRLEQNQNDLVELEEKMRVFQKEHGFIIAPEPGEMGINAVVEMYAMRAVKQLEVDIYEETMGPENPLYRRAKLELDAINRRLDAIPDLTVESLRIFRELLIQQKIFELLTPFLEEARLEEMRDTPTVIVLDRAVPAERQSRPKRLIITLAMGILSGVFLIGYIVVSEYSTIIRVTDPDKFKQLDEVGKILRNPFKKHG